MSGPSQVSSLRPWSRAHAALVARARAVLESDRADLRGLRALGNRSLRIVILVIRGILDHRLGLQGAALTYYSVFAAVPTLVVALRILQAMSFLPAIAPERLPVSSDGFTSNQLLQGALRLILETAGRTSELTSGVVGLVALLFAVSKMFGYTERALHIIAGSSQRTPRFSRLLGYVALLLMPPAVLAMSGLLLALFTRSVGRGLSGWLGAIPGLEIAAGICLGFGVLWLAVTIFYAAAVRARIPFSSAAVGGALAALALLVVLWVFTVFQIGVAQSDAIGTGFLAFPVFLLWVFSCWYTVLVGAEIAVAHRIDRVLIHGAAAFRLDAVAQREAGVAIMVRLTRAARRPEESGSFVSEDDLARGLRLPPHLVGGVALRLVERGLLAEVPRGYALRCDPDRTTLAVVIDALERDPTLAAAHHELASSGANADPTLGALADRCQPPSDS